MQIITNLASLTQGTPSLVLEVLEKIQLLQNLLVLKHTKENITGIIY